MDNAQNGAKLCQKSGLDHFNIEESDPMKSGAMSKHLFKLSIAQYDLKCVIFPKPDQEKIGKLYDCVFLSH